MKLIKINDNSKGGLCCSASIDPSIGCKNKCIGCYAAKASRIGGKFFELEPILKEYDDVEFRKDCKRYIRKGIHFIRLGKFCDAGDPALTGTVSKILKAATDENIRIIFVSKSLGEQEEIAKALIEGNHMLHMSLGMITEAQSNESRLGVWRFYKDKNVNAKLRIVEDVTRPVPDFYKKVNAEDTIFTPMRFASKTDIEAYGAVIDRFKFVSGYYRPIGMHQSWLEYIQAGCCGEIGESIFCCNCGLSQ